MKVLRTGADDLSALQACFFASVSVLTAADYSLQQRRAWIDRALAKRETWREKLSSQFGWKVTDEDHILGFVLLVPQDCLIDWLYVAPTAANSGVATLLLREVERTARILGMPTLRTEASLTAQPFFLRRGYALVEQRSVDIDGCVLPNALMEKTL
ncbi:GNAT family N-acetyltransferase [Silvimonas soli]|uniref:GNAT family N-acetyltransferase n=1 Tax=Silvimonas soli TaxID=2980100 RepID=UPI0024B33F9A|nr:GNAT family N-acetyltransferase [Silvimonas soli]